MRARLLCAILLAMLPACDSSPRAPALSDDALFVSASSGLKFVAPEKWMMTSRAELPTSALAKPQLLVRYVNTHPEKSGDLEVFVANAGTVADVNQFLRDHPVGGEKWTAEPGKAITVNGVEALRHDLKPATKPKGKADIRREVTVFSRKDRTYVFIITYNAADTAVRDSVRQCIASVEWGA